MNTPSNPIPKNAYRVALVILLMGLVWVVLVSYFNTRKTTMQVQVTGNVDEVLFYQVGKSDQPVAVLQTHGKDTTASVELNNSTSNAIFYTSAPTQYYFVAIQGEKKSQSRYVCCSTSPANQIGYLTIRDLNNYEQLHP